MRILGWLLLLALVSGLILSISYSKIFYSEKNLNTVFVIEKNESLQSVASRLESEKLVANRQWFLLGTKLTKVDTKIKAGYYTLDGTFTLLDLLNEFTKGTSKLIKVTFPEGLNCFEIFDILEKKGLGNKVTYLELYKNPYLFLGEEYKDIENLEGFLYPDTYFFSEKADERDIIRQMIREFNRNFSSFSPSETLHPYETLIMASLIEKETGNTGDEDIVSSVFHNRIKKNMRLQCDPTIIYALILEGRYDGNIRKKDIKMVHRFNTYNIYGLPPTPICNPGLNAMKAAAHPADTDFLYFVGNNTGSHIFSKTYKEHQQHVKTHQVDYWRKKWKRK